MRRESTITHYGVLGMKWGVRKDDESRGSKSGKFGSSNKTGSSISLENYKNKVVKTEHGDVAVTNYDKEKFKAADNFVNLIMKNRQPDRYADEETAKAALENLPKQTGWQSRNGQIVSNNHDAPNYARENNCFHCSIAFEMRMRGYDVQAKEKGTGWSNEAMHAFDVKDAFTIQISNPSGKKWDQAEEAYRQMEQKCLLYGDGARGILGIQYYTTDGGHAMYWVVENGEFKIIDSQKSGRNGYETFLHAETVDSDIDVIRLDNAEILPGVTDFVEAYELTEEEKAKKEALAKKIEEDRKLSNQKKAEQLKAIDDEQAKERDRQLAERRAEIEKMKKESARKTAEKKMTQLKEAEDSMIAERDRELRKKLSHGSRTSIEWSLRLGRR